MNVKGTIKAVIFDLDGTLLDTIPDIGTCFNAAMSRFGFPERPVREYEFVVGGGIKNAFRVALPKDVDPEIYEGALGYYLGMYPQHCTVKTDYYPGIRVALRELQELGYRLAIISNKTETVTQKIAAHFFKDVHFEFVWGRSDTRPLKPSPEAGKAAEALLGLSPEEIVYVGDGDADVEFCKNCGYHFIGVSWGYRGREVLKSCGANVIIDSAEQLVPQISLASNISIP